MVRKHKPVNRLRSGSVASIETASAVTLQDHQRFVTLQSSKQSTQWTQLAQPMAGLHGQVALSSNAILNPTVGKSASEIAGKSTKASEGILGKKSKTEIAVTHQSKVAVSSQTLRRVVFDVSEVPEAFCAEGLRCQGRISWPEPRESRF